MVHGVAERYGGSNMKVIRGTLVHCICPESIEVLENYVIGFKEKENGEVFIMNVQAARANMPLGKLA